MATGRTLFKKWMRVYVDGYDLSGYSRTCEPLDWTWGEADMTCPLSDGSVNVMPNDCTISMGALNTILDSTAVSGSHTILKTPAARKVMIPVGIRAAPAVGDDVWMGAFQQLGYQAADDGGAIVANIPFGKWDAAQLIRYAKPWGVLLHAYGAETAANTAVGIDDNGGASSNGGFMMYQIFTSNAAGTATVTVQDAAVNNDGGFALLAGATSGAIGFASIPAAGIVPLGNTADVRQYLRWQVALAGGMTTVTFALGFVRSLQQY